MIATRTGWTIPARPVLRVFEHHFMVYRRTWRGTLFTTLLAPALFLGAMGLGLGGFVDRGSPASLGGVSYLAFLAPGLLAAQAMQTAAFESTYPVMAGLIWLRTYLAMVSTPIGPRDIVLGQLLWVAARFSFVGSVFIFFMVAFGAVEPLRAPFLLPVAVLTGLAFAAPIQAFAATQRNDSAFAALFRFGITPLFIFSGTFFPISQLPALLQPVAYVTPLWHGVNLARAIALGHLDLVANGINVIVLVAFIAAGTAASLVTFRRKLVQ